ncbi:MAG: hypothetical protein GY789_22930 [Hyphomicrobiales bacterium]|nr:hypothetical protein [Hyphomicrobiales bacterium]MCP5000401.1 hypothetical protein [Hyphomicrobiales bacterium]
MSKSKAPGKKIRRLSDVVREARIAAAEREDAVVDMREADRARLELLADEIKPIFEEVPAADDQFDFYLSSGEQPRLWIDAIAHVHMGHDRRTYRFVRDTRFGRVVIAEEADMMTVADSVTRYVAERIVQRQRFLENDPLNVSRPAATAGAKKPRRHAETTAGEMQKTRQPDDGQASENVPASLSAKQFSVAAALFWFLFGLVVAGAVMATAFWEQIAPKITML